MYKICGQKKPASTTDISLLFSVLSTRNVAKEVAPRKEILCVLSLATNGCDHVFNILEITAATAATFVNDETLAMGFLVTGRKRRGRRKRVNADSQMNC